MALTANLVMAQTQVDLRSQGRNVDFSAISGVKPMPVGTVLPATCSTGEMFFKSDAQAGSNVYGCTSPNSWQLESGGTGGSSNGSSFSDLSSTVVAGSSYTIAAGRVNFSVNGLPAVLMLSGGTISRVSGADTGLFLIYADYNSGAPVLRCAVSGGINLANFAISSGFAGSTCVAGGSFPAFSIPLARMDVSTGVLQTPVDQRAPMSQDPVLAGAGLTLIGNVMSASGSLSGTGLTLAGNVVSTSGSESGAGGVKRVAYSSLPTCSSADMNTRFIFTDGTGLTAHCDGISHAYFYRDQAVALPGSVSGFTKVNAVSGNDVTDDQGGLYARAVQNGNLVTAIQSIGSATDIRAAVVFSSPGGEPKLCGLVLTDGTGTANKVTLFGRQLQSNIWVSQFTNYSSYSVKAASTQLSAADSAAPVWLRIVVGGTKQTFYISGDSGRTWEHVGTQANYETPTHYGVGCDAGSTSGVAGMLVVSLSAQ
jgi:hypothetical protein